MSQVNLLPPEVKTRQRTRRYTVAAMGAVGAVVVLVVVVFALQSLRLSQTGRALAAQQRVNQDLHQRITKLQPFDQLRQQVVSRQELTDGLLQGQVLWSGALRDVSAALPGGLWLTSLAGTLNPTAPGAVPTVVGPAQRVVGTLQFQGQALEHTTVGSWLGRLEQVHGWVNAWVSSSTRGGGTEANRKLVTFANSVDLTGEATTDRRQQ